MVFRETLDKDRSIFIYRVIRLPIELKPFIPILGTGLRLLLGSWEFSPVANRPRKNARVPLTMGLDGEAPLPRSATTLVPCMVPSVVQS